MGISILQLFLILLIILLLFGAGKLPKVMSELGKGLKSFKNSIKDQDDDNDNQDETALNHDQHIMQNHDATKDDTHKTHKDDAKKIHENYDADAQQKHKKSDLD